jgi:hypothetical protein
MSQQNTGSLPIQPSTEGLLSPRRMRANCEASRRRIFEHSSPARATPERAWSSGSAWPHRFVEASGLLEVDQLAEIAGPDLGPLCRCFLGRDG